MILWAVLTIAAGVSLAAASGPIAARIPVPPAGDADRVALAAAGVDLARLGPLLLRGVVLLAGACLVTMGLAAL